MFGSMSHIKFNVNWKSRILNGIDFNEIHMYTVFNILRFSGSWESILNNEGKVSYFHNYCVLAEGSKAFVMKQ